MKTYNLILISICLLFLTIPSKKYKEKLLSKNEEENKENLLLRNLDTEEEPANPTNYHKSSGGLSTGGAVGITIAGVVVAVAAVGIALVLKGATAAAVGTGAVVGAGSVGTVGGGVVANPAYLNTVQYNVPNPHFNIDNSGAVIVPHA